MTSRSSLSPRHTISAFEAVLDGGSFDTGSPRSASGGSPHHSPRAGALSSRVGRTSLGGYGEEYSSDAGGGSSPRASTVSPRAGPVSSPRVGPGLVPLRVNRLHSRKSPLHRTSSMRSGSVTIRLSWRVLLLVVSVLGMAVLLIAMLRIDPKVYNTDRGKGFGWGAESRAMLEQVWEGRKMNLGRGEGTFPGGGDSQNLQEGAKAEEPEEMDEDFVDDFVHTVGNGTGGARNGLNNMDMPTHKVHGGKPEPCLILSHPAKIEKLKLPPPTPGPVKKLLYYSLPLGRKLQPVPGQAEGEDSGPGGLAWMFTGNQSLEERRRGFEVREQMEVHCGFANAPPEAWEPGDAGLSLGRRGELFSAGRMLLDFSEQGTADRNFPRSGSGQSAASWAESFQNLTEAGALESSWEKRRLLRKLLAMEIGGLDEDELNPDVQEEPTDVASSEKRSGTETLSGGATGTEGMGGKKIGRVAASGPTFFQMDERDMVDIRRCKVAVVTAAFGGGDELYQPIGATKVALKKVSGIKIGL